MIRLFDPISVMEPHELLVPDDAPIWRSPAGHYCIGWTQMPEDTGYRSLGVFRRAGFLFTIFAFRQREPAELLGGHA